MYKYFWSKKICIYISFLFVMDFLYIFFKTRTMLIYVYFFIKYVKKLTYCKGWTENARFSPVKRDSR